MKLKPTPYSPSHVGGYILPIFLPRPVHRILTARPSSPTIAPDGTLQLGNVPSGPTNA